MKELAGGSYKFAADPSEAVFLGVDGGAALPNADRYVQMVIGPQDAYLDAAVSSRLAPTVTSRTLDVSATGEADANVATWLGTAPNALVAGNVSALANAITNGAIAAASFTAGAVDASALATDAATEIATALLDLANGVETGTTVRQALRIIGAMLAGNASGGPAGSVFRGLGLPATTRVTAVATAVGDRTMTLTP
jgi:hypothetical protein